MHSHDQHTHRLLSELEAGTQVSQRSLARNLGIALGLTNLLLRRVIRKGWVKATNIQRNRMRYLVTPTGLAEKARISREYLASSVKLYREARDRIQHTLSGLSRNWSAESGDKPILFFGGGEVAEIGYVCLHNTDLRLVGVIDNVRTTPFFGVPVHSVERLSPLFLGDVPYGRIIVMSFTDTAIIRRALNDRGIPPELVEWI